MKNNYPIKYTAMPIIEQVGWSHGEREYDVVCYIVSKCYLLSDKTKYKRDGTKEKEHEVVFPYQFNEFNKWQRVTPSFNILIHKCTNSNFVEKVFDSYEEALEFATNKNKKICEEKWCYLPYTEDLGNQISKITKEFNDKLSKYKILEQQILGNTSDLVQSNVKKLDKVIINNKDEFKILSVNLYDFLNNFVDQNYIVHSISLEQYNKLVTLIKNKDTFDIEKIMKNSTPILYYDCEAKENDAMIIDPYGNVLYCINKYKVLESSAERKIPSVELNAMNDKISHLFTNETLEDIILSFNEHKYINLNEIQGPVLRKELSDKNN